MVSKIDMIAIPGERRRFRVLKLKVAGAMVIVVFVSLGVRLVPSTWCSHQAAAWSTEGNERQRRLGLGVERWIRSGLTEGDFSTGHSHFDGEWLFGSYMMAGMGFGQLALHEQDSKRRQRHLDAMGLCIDQLLSRRVRRFDRAAWGNDPIDGLDGPGDHAAYLGYLNLVLGLHRRLVPDSRYAALNDRITRTLARRLARSRLLLLESFPGEVFPVDNGAVVGSIGLHDLATGADHARLLRRWEARLRRRSVDPVSGLLFQRVHADDGTMADLPRGSGTALAIYFLSFSHPELSRQLYDALKEQLADTFLGFGVVREYPDRYSGSPGDIDSGPVVLGYGLSATGFTLAGSRIHGDRDLSSRLASTVHLFGAPLDRGESLEFVTGGPLGNAIIFAMLTAPTAGLQEKR
jgi:hypothetical protein